MKRSFSAGLKPRTTDSQAFISASEGFISAKSDPTSKRPGFTDREARGLHFQVGFERAVTRRSLGLIVQVLAAESRSLPERHAVGADSLLDHIRIHAFHGVVTQQRGLRAHGAFTRSIPGLQVDVLRPIARGPSYLGFDTVGNSFREIFFPDGRRVMAHPSAARRGRLLPNRPTKLNPRLAGAAKSVMLVRCFRLFNEGQ